MFKVAAKKIISHSVYAYQTYLVIYFFRFHRKVKNKLGNSSVLSNLLGRQDVINRIVERKVSKKASVCHVIGSGWSLNNSEGIISESDFVIGFNYAALANMDFDAYFFEFGGYGVVKTSRSHLNLARDIVSKKTDLVFFKNIWENKNDVAFIEREWIPLASPVKDRIYPCLDEKNIDIIVRRCFEDDSDYIPQFCSTVFTSIVMAYQAGFKKIVVHGLDFGGSYFYESNDRCFSSIYLPPEEAELDFYVNSGKGSVHPTASGKAGMKDLLPLVLKYLTAKNVDIFCATEVSPSSDFLPVYNKEA